MVFSVDKQEIQIYDILTDKWKQIKFKGTRIYPRPIDDRDQLAVIYVDPKSFKIQTSFRPKIIPLKFYMSSDNSKYFLKKVPKTISRLKGNFYTLAIVNEESKFTGSLVNKHLMLLKLDETISIPLIDIPLKVTAEIDFPDWDVVNLESSILAVVNIKDQKKLLVINVGDNDGIHKIEITYSGNVRYLTLPKKDFLGIILIYHDEYGKEHIGIIQYDTLFKLIKQGDAENIKLEDLINKQELDEFANIVLSKNGSIISMWRGKKVVLEEFPWEDVDWEELNDRYTQPPIPLDNKENILESTSERFVESEWTMKTLSERLLNEYGQIILYGPPGTGKTHLARTIGKQYGENLEGHHYEFVTFHKSYSYEDFVEGYRPKTTGEKIEYPVVDGIFKRITIRAIYELLSEETKERLLPGYKEKIETQATNRAWESLLFDLKNQKSIIRPDIEVDESSKYIKITPKGKKEDYIHNVNELEEKSEKYPDLVSIFHQYKAEAMYLGIKVVVHRFLEELNQELNSRGMLDPEKLKGYFVKNPSKFYLVIDEINRADVSHVFGELITLLEKDKRLSRDNRNPIIVRLPYSRELFAIPENLYIIGTMNSADRGISLLDVAIRRRFAFLEVQPDHRTLDGLEIHGIRIDKLLLAINKKIIQSKGSKDYQIGHSYFLELKSILSKGNNDQALQKLMIIWYHRILPLLQEYYYMRWDELGMREFIDDTGMINWELMSSPQKFIDALKRLIE